MSGGATGGQTLLHASVKAYAAFAALTVVCFRAPATAQTATAPSATSKPTTSEPLWIDTVDIPSIEDRTGDLQSKALVWLLSDMSVLSERPQKPRPASLDTPAYDNLLSYPLSYRMKAVRVAMQVRQVLKVDPSAERWAQADRLDRPIWRLEGFNAASPQDVRTSQPLIVYTPLDPSSLLEGLVKDGAVWTASSDRRSPVVELAGVFYKLYRARDTGGELRDYPVVVAWDLGLVSAGDKRSPLAIPMPVLLAVLALAMVFLLLRAYLRRTGGGQGRAKYRPRRYGNGGDDDARGDDVPGSDGAAPAPIRQQGSLRVVTVALGGRSYDVLIGPGAMNRLGQTAASLGGARQVVVVADSTVAELYGRKAMDSLAAAGLTATVIDFPAGEEHKTLTTYGAVMDELLAVEPPIDRDSLIVALGGGVAGDLAGFVAATALRGLRWVACPTTLLADVDASVGGKTAVDHPSGKNLIGAFHQPRAVVIDVSVLKTLDARQLRTGLAECVKHGMIRDESLLDFIKGNARAILAAQEPVMTELVARNVAIKAAVVAADERESDQRSHLNFGHTIGHAIETHLGVGKITHGEAVSLGMVAACELAVRRGLIDAAYARRLKDLLAALGLPVAMAGLDAATIWGIMQHDKKVRGGRVRMVLPTSPGRVDTFDDIREPEIAEVLAAVNG